MTRLPGILTVAIIALFIFPATNHADDPPVELGKVKWHRDLEQAKQLSADSQKPVLILFQEVPGCQTCQDFGNGPMSHPLMVEAIEDLFVPVLIYNNKEHDEKILNSFEEPSWNNPVIRFINAAGDDVIPRQDGVWETIAVASRMVESLKSAERDVPHYLLYVAGGNEEAVNQATFAMHCYWVGEAKLGALDGVLSTHSAWIGEKEVVQLTFDPAVIDYETLLKKALEMECASTVYAHDEAQRASSTAAGADVVDAAEHPVTRDAKESDQKYYLRNSVYRHLPLTELQAVKINGALDPDNPSDPAVHLSPRQREMLVQIEGLLKTDEQALAEYVCPNEADLVAYHQRLSELLDEHGG
ncbi:MAG: VPGUxxT family thioredoxin-like (seleno)protein, type 2 [Pirellulaceae bacterium]